MALPFWAVSRSGMPWIGRFSSHWNGCSTHLVFIEPRSKPNRTSWSFRSSTPSAHVGSVYLMGRRRYHVGEVQRGTHMTCLPSPASMPPFAASSVLNLLMASCKRKRAAGTEDSEIRLLGHNVSTIRAPPRLQKPKEKGKHAFAKGELLTCGSGL